MAECSRKKWSERKRGITEIKKMKNVKKEERKMERRKKVCIKE